MNTQARGGAQRRLAALEAAIQPGGEQESEPVVIVKVQPGLIEALTGEEVPKVPFSVVRVVLPDSGRGDAGGQG